MNKKKSVSIIAPCYNEEENIEIFSDKIYDLFQHTKYNYEIIFINDGSTDRTLQKMHVAKQKYTQITVVNLSRNFGKEAALTAGLDCCKLDAAIPMDVDLQDPPDVIYELLKKWEEGYDVIVAKRINRDADSYFKRIGAFLFYKIHSRISDIDISENVGDFRLISKKVILALKLLPENQRYMKGIFAWVGFKTATVSYSRKARKNGQTSFNIFKLWDLALSGITSFSIAPLRFWLYIGFFVSLISFLYGLFIISRTLIFGIDLPGYASLVTITLFLGGIQLISIGVLGEYIGRIFLEAKRRPSYIIDYIDQGESIGSDYIS